MDSKSPLIHNRRMEETIPTMRGCYCCGKWFVLSEGSSQVYCSEACGQQNLCCTVCSSYFAKNSGFQENPPLCSESCAATVNHYQYLFKEQQ